MDNELYFGIALSLLKGIGDNNAKQLISYAGGVEQLFKLSSARLQKINGVGQKIAAVFEDTKDVFLRAEQELKFIEKNNIQALLYYDKRYPKRLLNCPDAPLILYCKGNFDFNKDRFVNVIGTRHATEQGKEITEQLIVELAKYDVNLVSGLAFGIDICAHKAANKVGMQNIAVLAHGLDRLYPAQHKNTAEKLQENGALVSDFLSGTIPDRQNFPDRNRIVAGMTDATIVIESAASGGALITAEFANNYNKDVFAFPGRISDEYSIGCMNLIKNHKAQLVTSAKDIIDFMNWDLSTSDKISPPIQPQLFLELNEQEEKIYSILKQEEKIHIDKLTQHAQFPMSVLSSVLLQLEMKGIITTLPGKQYKIIS
ncbi:MAG: DNA-processing protein DprA [Chitinophagales bacterium]|nr:DNA-processing protein DprA [Chitinophagales bacterium]